MTDGGLQGNITVTDPGISHDGRASAVIDYGGSESILFRALRDEIRRVRHSLLFVAQMPSDAEASSLFPLSLPLVQLSSKFSQSGMRRDSSQGEGAREEMVQGEKFFLR